MITNIYINYTYNLFRFIKMKKEKKEIVFFEGSVFEYKRVISYFMTIFFTFFLMLILLLVIALSREVLSDRDFEEYVLQTKSLINELEEVEENKFSAYENYSLNVSNYESKTIFNRLDVDDYSKVGSKNNNFSFLTLKINYEIELYKNESLVILDIKPELGDDILVIVDQEPSKAKLIDILEDGTLIVIVPHLFTDIGEFYEVNPRNYKGVFLE